MCPQDKARIERDPDMNNVARTIEYTTNLDGWGAAPSDEEQASFCAYVVHRLEQTYPGSDVTAEIDEDALTSVCAVATTRSIATRSVRSSATRSGLIGAAVREPRAAGVNRMSMLSTIC